MILARCHVDIAVARSEITGPTDVYPDSRVAPVACGIIKYKTNRVNSRLNLFKKDVWTSFPCDSNLLALRALLA